jgi:small subunit ribosomal protein S16
MTVSIRLSRGGMKKRPYYRIVVTDARSARDGKFIEKIGTYNPMLPKDSTERIKLDSERAAHWLSVGAQPSDRVARFLDAAGVRTREARQNLKKGQPGEKSIERAQKLAERIAASEGEKDYTAALYEDFTVNVFIDSSDNNSLIELANAANNFVNFLGYAAEVETLGAT